MANFMTYLGDQQILMEAPASGAFAKSDLEVQPDPQKALINIIDLLRRVATEFGREIGPALGAAGGALELRFAVRSDAFGLVMLAEDASVGQFQCTLKLLPPRPPTARPPATHDAP